MQAGKLERCHWGAPATSQQHDTGMCKVRCPTHISLAQLKTAYAEFKVKKVPDLVAAAAQSPDDVSPPHQADQPDHSDAPQHRQTPAPNPIKGGLHTSPSTGAVTGMAPPAYATQMDGPNDVLDALAATAADSDGLEEPSRATVTQRDAEGVLESGDKRDGAALDASDIGPAKKAKSGEGPPLWPR